MPSIVVELSEPWHDWVRTRVESGAYRDEAEYLVDLVRRDREARQGDQAIASALAEGERSGHSRHRVPDILARLRSERNGDAA